MIIPRKLPLLAAASLVIVYSASAADITWDITPGTVGSGDSAITGGAGTWDNSLGNWTTDAGANNFAWDNTLNAGDTAVFGGTAGTVTLNNAATAINAAGLTFGTNATYTIAGQTATDGINFGSSAGTINSTALSTSQTATISANLFGSGGLSLAGNGNTTATGGGVSGRLVISGVNTGLTGGIAITGGLVTFGSSSSAGSAATTAGSGNAITLSGGGGILANTSLTLGNNIALAASNTGTLRVFGGQTLTLNGVVSGSGTLNKTDNGTLLLANNANTFTGAVAVQAGTLQLGNLTATSTHAFTGNALSVASGATLNFGGSSGGTVTHTYNFANLAAPIAVDGGTVSFASSNSTTKAFNAALDFSGNSTIGYTSSAYTHNLNLNRAVTGTGTLNFTWSGGASARNINFASGQTNNYTGSVVLGAASGAVTMNLNSTLGAADWTINDADWNVRLSGTTHTFKSLTGSVGGSVGSVSGATTLDIGGGNTNTAFSGTLVNGGGTLALTKSGTGSLTLSGTNTYSGATLVNAGTLVTGNISALGSGAVTVAGGTLQTGAAGVSGIASLAITGGTLDIAAAAGAVVTTGAFSMAGGTWLLGSTIDGVTAGSFTLTGGIIDLGSLSASILDGTSAYSLIAGTGTSSLTNANFTGGNSLFSYGVDTNGDLVVSAIPEPSTYGLLGAGTLAAAAFVRRRRRKVV